MAAPSAVGAVVELAACQCADADRVRVPGRVARRRWRDSALARLEGIPATGWPAQAAGDVIGDAVAGVGSQLIHHGLQGRDLMCGIAGMIDLSGQRPAPAGVVPAMAEAIVHRGPDEDGFLERPGLASPTAGSASSACRRPAADRATRTAPSGPSSTASSSTTRRSGPSWKRKGHRFRTHCDTELIPHLWEDHREEMFEHLQRPVRLLPVGQPHQRGRPGPRPLRHLPAVLHARQARRPTGCCSPPRSRRCSPPAWSSRKADLRGSTTSSRSSPCPARSPASRASSCLLPGRYLHFKLGRHHARAGRRRRRPTGR